MLEVIREYFQSLFNIKDIRISVLHLDTNCCSKTYCLQCESYNSSVTSELSRTTNVEKQAVTSC